MATNPVSLRRRAAYAVLAPLIDEDSLIAALWLQHDGMRGDAVSDIIGYIDKVADLHLFDAATRKKLYEGYFKALKQPEQDLPMDPWPLMQASRPGTAPAAPPSVAQVVLAPVAVPAPNPAPAPTTAPVAPTLSSPPAQEPPQRPEVVVFGTLWREVLAEVQTFHPAAFDDLRQGTLSGLSGARLNASIRQQVQEAWQQPAEQSWLLNTSETELAELVNLLYVALCEALGPVEADQVLTRAVKAASLLPQARQFSPRRLI
jgi:hypothetical protein